MATTAGVLEILIKTKDETSSGLSAAENKVKSFTGSMSSWAVAKGQLISNFVQKTGKAVISLGKDAVSTSMSFDKAMSQYMATRGATIEALQDETSDYYKEMQQMTKFARQMGLEGKYSATEVAEALNYMALAGYKADVSMEMMPQVLALAAAGDMELARASDIVTDAQTAFGLKIGETKTMVDQMAKTASITNTSVEQLGEAFLTVGANARSIIHNGDTSELNAILGQLASNGIKGAKGGTVLRNILSALSNPAGKAAKQLKDIGVSAYDSNGNLRNMTDILVDMGEALSGETMEKQAEFFAKAFNVRDTAAVKALLDVSKKGWKSLTQEIIDSKNAAENMKNVQLDNLDGDVTKLKNSFQEAKLAIVEGLTPSLRNYVKSGIILVQRLTNAFKRKGLKGAIEEAGAIFNNFIKTFKESDSPVLQKLGGALEGVKTVAKEVWGLITDFPGKLQEWESSDSPGLQALASIFGSLSDAVSVVEAAFNGGLGGAIDKLKELDTPFSNLAASGIGIFKEVCEVVAGNSNIGGIIETIAKGFILLKGFEITGSLLNFVTKLSMLKFLTTTSASQFASAGATAGTSWGAAFGSAIMNAIPWLAGLITLLNPDGSGMNGSRDEGGEQGDIYDEEGIITQGGKDAGFTQEDVDKEIEAAKEYRDAHQQMLESTGLTDKQIKAIKDFNAQLSLHKQGSSSFDNENYTNAWKNLQKAFEGQDEALSAYMDKLKGLTPQDVLDDSFFDINKNGVQIPFTPDMSAVESAEVPTLHGTVEYSAEFSDGGGVIETPFGKTYHRRKPKAKGDWYVPYDDYPALLHRGEMVLTKSQARQFRDGDGGGFDVGSAISNAVASAMSKVYVMMNGDKVGDLTTKRVKKNINASSYNKLRAMGG